MLMVPLVEDSASGFDLFLERLIAGAELEEALQETTGQGLEAYGSLARARAREFLEERRARAMAGLIALERARQGDPGVAIQLTSDMLAEELPPLVRGWALWVRAKAFEHAGRTEEAVHAWRRLADGRVEHPSLLDFALIFQAQCLMRLGRDAEARPLLIELGRGTADAAVRQRAGEYLERLDDGDR